MLTMAAEQANAMEFINEMPNGFNTIVGSRGINLSGFAVLFFQQPKRLQVVNDNALPLHVL
jgi:ABC-type protease/lipase transport system fused ATPase/permease subunit